MKNPVACCLLILLAPCAASCSPKDAAGAGSPRLEVDDQHWPVGVLEPAQTTIDLVAKRGEPAYLTEIDVQVPDAGTPAPVTAVTYLFYLPRHARNLASPGRTPTSPFRRISWKRCGEPASRT